MQRAIFDEAETCKTVLITSHSMLQVDFDACHRTIPEEAGGLRTDN